MPTDPPLILRVLLVASRSTEAILIESMLAATGVPHALITVPHGRRAAELLEERRSEVADLVLVHGAACDAETGVLAALAGREPGGRQPPVVVIIGGAPGGRGCEHLRAVCDGWIATPGTAEELYVALLRAYVRRRGWLDQSSSR